MSRTSVAQVPADNPDSNGRHRPAQTLNSHGIQAPFTYPVHIEPQGWHFDAAADKPLLTSAREAGIVMPSSCRNGTCRTCLCRVTQGQVVHQIEWPGLSAEEKLEGWILPCVALPRSALRLESPRASNQRGAV